MLDVLDALLTRTRQRILGLFLMRPEARFHLREVARQTGRPVATVQRELASLAQAGIVTKEVSGNRTYYQANAACPIFPELRGLVLKTVGLADVLREALAPVGDGMQAAFVYGSMAGGEAGPESDVDLMVVGDVDEMELHRAVGEAEKVVARTVNYTLLSEAELRRRRREKGGFLARVLHGPKIPVLGDLDALRSASSPRRRRRTCSARPRAL